MDCREIEERHGYAGALPSVWGLGRRQAPHLALVFDAYLPG